MAQGLLEYETLSGDEILGLMEGKAPVRETDNDQPPPRSSQVPTAGKGRPKPEAGAGGLEPQPQA